LTSLGLLPRRISTRRNAPDTAPAVFVESVRGRVVNIRVCEAGGINRRRKAFGAHASQIFSYVGGEPPTNGRAYQLECTSTRTSATIVFPNSVPSGATVWLSAQWISARGELSTASTPIQFTLQGGAITAMSQSATDGTLRAAA